MVALGLLQRRVGGPACVYRYFSLATRWGVVCPAPAGAVGGQRLRFGRYVTVPRLVPTTAPECHASLWGQAARAPQCPRQRPHHPDSGRAGRVSCRPLSARVRRADAARVPRATPEGDGAAWLVARAPVVGRDPVPCRRRENTGGHRGRRHPRCCAGRPSRDRRAIRRMASRSGPG